MLAPLAGVVGQDAIPYTSEWLPVGPGSYLQLTLTLTKITGTLSVVLETLNDPATDSPRFCGNFTQTNVVGSVQAGLLSDSFVRVIATPGAGVGQLADWLIEGNAFLPFAPGV
ncbi:MAG: hypothetical protein ABJE95_16470 [Byssovorax sp.]